MLHNNTGISWLCYVVTENIVPFAMLVLMIVRSYICVRNLDWDEESFCWEED